MTLVKEQTMRDDIKINDRAAAIGDQLIEKLERIGYLQSWVDL